MRRKENDDERRASRVVAVTTAKRAGRGGALWGLVFGATIAATESTYLASFPTAASRARLALSVQGNAGFEAVFGPIRRMDTVAGYTAYKTTLLHDHPGRDLGVVDRDPHAARGGRCRTVGAVPLGAHDPGTRGAAGGDRPRGRARRAVGADRGPRRRGGKSFEGGHRDSARRCSSRPRPSPPRRCSWRSGCSSGSWPRPGATPT